MDSGGSKIEGWIGVGIFIVFIVVVLVTAWMEIKSVGG